MSKLKDQLTERLENAEMAKALNDKPLNLLILMPSENSAAVDSEIEEWAAENQINLFHITPDGKEIRRAIKFVKTAAYCSEDCICPTEMQLTQLNRTNTVVLLHSIDQFQDTKYRRWLFGMMNSHLAASENQDDAVRLENYLFTIATSSPMTSAQRFEICTEDAKDSFVQCKL